MPWPQDAYVGQKVVMIHDPLLPSDVARPDFPEPPKNTPVTVSWVGVAEGYNVVVIDLVEYPCPESLDFNRGYDAKRFRPAQTTGMDMLQRLLTRETEDA